jgi:hypothetical protein
VAKAGVAVVDPEGWAVVPAADISAVDTPAVAVIPAVAGTLAAVILAAVDIPAAVAGSRITKPAIPT